VGCQRETGGSDGGTEDQGSGDGRRADARDARLGRGVRELESGAGDQGEGLRPRRRDARRTRRPRDRHLQDGTRRGAPAMRPSNPFFAARYFAAASLAGLAGLVVAAWLGQSWRVDAAYAV